MKCCASCFMLVKDKSALRLSFDQICFNWVSIFSIERGITLSIISVTHLLTLKNYSIKRIKRTKALKELQEDQDLVIRKADKSTLVLVDKDYYYDTLVVKHHLNTSTYQKAGSNSDKRVFKNLKLITKKHESCLTENEMKYILNSNCK